jgi:hypothetical protein
MRSILLSIALSSLPLLSGCEKAGAEHRDKMDDAQARADQEIAKARAEAEAKAREAEAEAAKKISAAATEFAKVREDYRHDMQSKIDDMNKTLADLDAKALKAKGEAKAKLDAALPELHKQRDAFVADFKSVQVATADTWDATKERLDKEWKDLKDAVDKVD